MNVADLLPRPLESIAPLAYAEDWDNVGLLAGDPAAPLARALLCIDCTREVVAEAAEAGCEAIVAYHPPLFRPITRVTRGSIPYELVRRGIALYSPHTALDAAEGGTNDVLADAIGMKAERTPLRASAPQGRCAQARDVRAGGRARARERGALRGRRGADRQLPRLQLPRARNRDVLRRGRDDPRGGERPRRTRRSRRIRLETIVPLGRAGDVVRALRAIPPVRGARVRSRPPRQRARTRARMGRIGALDPIDRRALVARIKERLGVSHLLVAGPTDGDDHARSGVRRGGREIGSTPRSGRGAEAIVAGEMRHHDALRAAEAGVTVVCALHSNSERIALGPLGQRIAAALPGLEIVTSRVDRDPFTIV